MRINENIRRLREARGMTEAGLAKQLGIGEEEARALETGDTDIPASEIYEIAKVLRVAPGTLFDWQSHKGDGAYDVVLRIYGREDRATVMSILAMNGYDVGQHKEARTMTGKTVDYFVHAKLLQENADTSR